MKKDLTVIVPAFNAERTIERCLLSIVNQTYKNLCVIVVNDCSTDNTAKILERYDKNYNNIEIVTNENNLELGRTRNYALKWVNSEYVTFIDSDDWVDTDAYQKCMTSIQKNNSDLAIFGIKNEFDNKVLSQIRYNYTDNLISGEYALNLLCNTFATDFYISPIVNNKIYRTSLLKTHNIKFDEYPFYEDMSFSYRVLKNANRISLVDKVFYHYYQNPNSKTHNITNVQIEYFCASLKALYQSLTFADKKDQELYYAYLDKSVAALVERIDRFIVNENDKKSLLLHLFDGLGQFVKSAELVDYLDVRRIINAMRRA